MDQEFYPKHKIRKMKLSAMLLLSLNITLSSFAWAGVSSYADCKDGTYCATLNSINPYNMYSLPSETKGSVTDQWGTKYNQYGKDLNISVDNWKRKEFEAPYVNYKNADHKEVSISIDNLNSTQTAITETSSGRYKIQWQGLELKARGKDDHNLITLKGNIKEEDTGDISHYRNLSIDFKNVHYIGDITLKGSKDSNIKNNIVMFSDSTIKLDGLLTERDPKKYNAYNRSPGSGGYVHMDNVILDGNLKMTDVSFIKNTGFEPFTITNSTINGDIDWSSNESLTLQLINDTFNNSRLTFLRDSLPGFSISSGQVVVVDGSKFINSIIKYDYAPTATIDKKYGTFSTYTYTNNTFKNSKLEIKDSSVLLWLEHTSFEGGNIDITSDAKILPSRIDFTGSKVSLKDLKITGGATSLGAVFNFKKMTQESASSHTYKYKRDVSKTLAATDTNEESMTLKDIGTPPPLEILTDFSGNILLAGGKNIFNIYDQSSLHDGSINITGGLNSFDVKDKASLDRMNINVKAQSLNVNEVNAAIPRVRLGTKSSDDGKIHEYQEVWDDKGTKYICNAIATDRADGGGKADGRTCFTSTTTKDKDGTDKITWTSIQASELNKQITSVATSGKTISTDRRVYTSGGVQWTCKAGDSSCIANPDNTFTFTDASYKNSLIDIKAGTRNIFKFENAQVDNVGIKIGLGENNSFSFTKNSHLKNTNIQIDGGKTNFIKFEDSSKIGGNITIGGGEFNTLSFKNTSLPTQLSKQFSPDATLGGFTPIRAAILKSRVDDAFLKGVETIAAQNFKGDILINANGAYDSTINSLAFDKIGVNGNVIVSVANKGIPKKFYTTINGTDSLFKGDFTFNGKGMITREKFTNSAIFGNINVKDGSSYLTLDNSTIYGDVITTGGINIISVNNNSVFAGSINTYGGTSYIDISQSMIIGQNDNVSRINTYGGTANITLSINDGIAQLLAKGKPPVFEVNNQNNSTSNIGIFGPISGTGHIDYSGGNVNLAFADAGDLNDPRRFFTNGSKCPADGFVSQICLAGAVQEFSPEKVLYKQEIKDDKGKVDYIAYWNAPAKGRTRVGNGVYRINGYTFMDGVAFTFDAKLADEILRPFRDLYPKNYATITIDKSDAINPAIKDKTKAVYRIELGGFFAGAEYNLTSSKLDGSTLDNRYEVTFKPNSVFVGTMAADTKNTEFILNQGVKLIFDSKSKFNISSLSGTEPFEVDTHTMFDSTLAQKGNVIIDLATQGKTVNRVFHKEEFSTVIVNKMNNFNNAIFRLAIDANKSETSKNINDKSITADRVIVQSVPSGQHLSNYIQVYQDYTNLKTGDLSDKNILLAIVKNDPSGSSAVFDTSASNVKQGFDLVSTDIVEKRISLDDKTGAIDINPATPNATGYFVGSISTEIDPDELNKTDNAIASNYSIYLANINNLNKRLGEVRDNFYAQGVWSRVFNGLTNNNYGNQTSKIYSTNIQFGYDYGWKTRNGQQFLGVAGTYGYNVIQGSQYNASVQVGEAAAYYSYVGDSGLFLDTILKYSYLHNSISLADNYLSSVPLDNHIGSLGVELGYRLYMDKKKAFYLEPSVEVIGGMINEGFIEQISAKGLLPYAPEYMPTLKTSLHDILNLRSKAGVSFGYRLLSSTNETSFRVSAYYVGDFNFGGRVTYKTNYSGAEKTLLRDNHQVMINLGLNSVLNENWRVYADLDSGFLGQYFSQTYLVSAGLRYEFGRGLTPLATKLTQEKRNALNERRKIRIIEQKTMVAMKQQKLKQEKDFKKQVAQIAYYSKNPKFKTDRKFRTQVILEKHKIENKNLQESQALELATLKREQEAQMRDLQVKQKKAQRMLQLRQLTKMAAANKAIKTSLKASQTKETKKLQLKQAKELKKLKASQTKKLKALQEKQTKEIKTLQNKQALEGKGLIAQAKTKTQNKTQVKKPKSK